jgi:ABC-2 type transport system permease protein
VRALSQVLVILLLALLLRVAVRWDAGALLGVLALVLLGAMVFSTFSVIIACLVKTRERFMGIGQVLTMPLFFASNAIYPTSMMPRWLQAISHVNPLTYQIDGLRAFLLPAGHLAPLGIALDLTVLAVSLIGLVALSAKIYPNIVR